MMKIKDTRQSFSSDDEVPLKYCITNGADQYVSYRSLCRRSVEVCEFCDKTFTNRYKSLIHNATHIIIPLLNQTALVCEECLFCFTSQNDLQYHINEKHPNVVNNEILPLKPIIRQDKKSKKDRIKNRIRFEDDEDLNNVSSILLDDLTTDCTVALGVSHALLNKAEEFKKYKSNNSFAPHIDITDDTEDDRADRNLYQNKYVFGKYRHVAQDDFAVENKVYNSFVNSFGKKDEVHLEFEDASAEEECEVVNGEGDVEHFESVHYDVLRKPKTVRCRHCKLKFRDKYDLIIHEITHIAFDTTLPNLCVTCDWYIAGDRTVLDRHIKTHHPDFVRREGTHKCLQCGLFYRCYILHAENYHRSDHEEDTSDKYDKIMEICDLCYVFLKSRPNRYYIKMGSVSRLGQRYTCSRCMRKFFELNRVKKTQVKHNWNMEKRQIKRLTNNQRLKNIQHRLKKINKLRKF